MRTLRGEQADNSSINVELFPGTVHDFVEHSLYRNHDVVWARLSSDEGLPTPHEVVTLVTSPLIRSSAVRVVTGGVTQKTDAFSEKFQINGRILDDSLSAISVRRAFSTGSTLIVEDVGKWHAPVARLCNSIFNKHWCLLNASYFLTRSQARGMPFHADEETTLVFQISGTKRWHVATYAAERLGATRVPEEATVLEIDLQPGDVLLVPPYFPHDTEAIGPDDSVHLTIGVRPFKVRDLIMQMGVSRFARMDALHAECDTVEGSLESTIEAISKVPEGVWSQEVAKASVHLLTGGLSRGLALAASSLMGPDDGISELLWKVQVGHANLVMFAGTFAMMDDGSVSCFEALLERKKHEGITWRQVASEWDVPQEIKHFLHAAALVDKTESYEIWE